MRRLRTRWKGEKLQLRISRFRNDEDRGMNLLNVDLYQSATNPKKFLAVPSGVDPATLTGPMIFDKDYAQTALYRAAFEFDPAQTYAGVNAAQIAADLLTVKWAMYTQDSR